jgi:formimidoylglutamate deiminase
VDTEREIRCLSALTTNGWTGPVRIVLDGVGFITGVEPLDNAAAGHGLDGLLVPGTPNLHSHAFQRQMAGLAERGSGQADSFWTWRETMYRLANRLTPEQFESIAAWVQAEMLEAGYTSCAEFHYLHHQPGGAPYADLAEMCHRLFNAAAASGMALTVLPVLYCRSGFGADDVNERQRRFRNPPERFLELVDACRRAVANHPLHRVGIAPHSLRAVAPDQLRAVVDQPTARAGPIHIHIAEQLGEVEECRSALGATPVAWLLQQHDVTPDWCLVHATHMAPDELRAAAASGAVAGLCPSTEADLGDGSFEAESWIDAGGRFGIGSDSNLRVSVSEELRLLEFQSRLRGLRRIVLAEAERSCGRSLFERAVQGGAQALAQPVGRIEPGVRADLVELDACHPLLAGRSGDAILDSWIFAGGAAMVRSVWVAGRRQVRDGRHVRRSELEGPFRKAMGELL